ncbi:MAG: TRAP-type transport system periplasmic protein [Sphaerochaeta sp.]|nr:TRAP-type transport system periplasmic protein [Sphaerochaeta sp.]
MMVLVFSFAFANGTAEGAAKTEAKKNIEIKLAHENSVDQPIHRYSEMFAKKVAEYSEGRIKVTVYPAGQLGNMTDLTTNVSLGLVDMCIIDNANLINYLPEYSLPSLPMMISSWDQAEKVFDSDYANELNKKLAEEHNIHILGWWWNGFRNMCSTKPINSISDFKGIKFRSPGYDNYLAMFELLGAKPTVIPWGETYSSMQTGIVDGMETTTEAIYSQGFYTLGNHIILTRHIFTANAPVIGEKLWNSLSAADQAILQKAMDESTAALRKEVKDAEDGYLEKLRATGCDVVELKDSDKLVDVFVPYWTEFADANDAHKFLDLIISLK